MFEDGKSSHNLSKMHELHFEQKASCLHESPRPWNFAQEGKGHIRHHKCVCEMKQLNLGIHKRATFVASRKAYDHCHLITYHQMPLG
eukprot:8993725-Ditylum_brightwellii.AAC.1